MKLAEALIERSDIQKRVEQLKKRLKNSVKVQDGEKPFEEPGVLLNELDLFLERLEILIQKINRTNSFTKVEGDLTISDILAKRDVIILKRKTLVDLLDEAVTKHDRYSLSEIKYNTTINVQKLQKEVDQLAKYYREIDTKIQQLNWNVDLI